MKTINGIIPLCIISLIFISCTGTLLKEQPLPPTEAESNRQTSADNSALAGKRLQNAMEERKLLLQQNRAFAQNYLELGKRDYENLKLESAKVHLQLALRYDPELREASILFEKVQGLLGERPDRVKSFMDRAAAERNVRTEQMLLEIENLIREGDACLGRREFSKAEDAFKAALLMTERLPYYSSHQERMTEIREKLQAAKSK